MSPSAAGSSRGRVIQAGKLRSLIEIQARDSGQDAGGQPAITWTTWQTVWARVRSVGGSELFSGKQYSPETTHEVTIRWLDGLTAMHRIVTDDNRILDILYVNYGERKIDPVICVCKERAMRAGGDEDVG